MHLKINFLFTLECGGLSLQYAFYVALHYALYY